MVVISLTDCPPKLRGDLTKWLCEINTGVYVGKLGTRVRDELWERVCEHLSQGKATMVYSAPNEQGLEFRVHNTTWEPVDFDGLKLMRRPMPGRTGTTAGPEQGTSRAAQFLKARRIQASRQRKEAEQGFVVVDLETSGLSPQKDGIIEIGALLVVGGEIRERFSVLVKPPKPISRTIQHLTGLTQEMLEAEGVEEREAVQRFLTFIGERRLIYHNAGFDRAFLQKTCEMCGSPAPGNSYTDTMVLAKRALDEVENYKLETLANYFGWEGRQRHRAIEDCELTLFVYRKLNEIMGS